MPSEHTPDTTSTTDGPRLLEERSIGGILVHFVAIPTGVVGAGLVYLVSTHEFTRRNARNALDWHLTVLALTILTFGSLFIYAEGTGQGATDVATLPSPVSATASVVLPVLISLWMFVTFWTFLVGLIAMGKATFGTAWRYPLSPALVDRFGPRVDLPGGWPVIIVVYVAVAPLIVGVALFGPREGAAFFASGLGLVALILVLTPITGVALYQHGARIRPTDADWQPPVVAYLGVPIAVAAAGYLLSEAVTDSINPAGDAVYVFLAAFWVASLVYAVRWWTESN
ncbi:DUF4870 domain-containing protein [Natrarchaeobius halalkaliphilus]|uniref:DUF4870 domain-containing protein n=1 Tax=Natrarchaeobius halalkaliphilus TaxID=1679091 RepID=A0A3N6LJX5_9EURY|nr:DUF4870 domain-containing protein [Natrarchaeobius halalkaliphilus]RQG86648.1 DUF4870 domain-containing protein [Natrarchaeobius halalkaliphilus]